METNSKLSPLDTKAMLYSNLLICSCSELEHVIDTVKRVLTWCNLDDTELKRTYGYQSLLGDIGSYYIILGIMDHMNLVTHGVSIRYPSLTDDGKRLLEALNEYSIEEITSAKGKAYDGDTYD